MAVKAEIAGQKAKSGTYSATESVGALKTIVATDLREEAGFTVSEPVDGASGAKVIKIRYSNTALKAGGIDEGVPAQNGHVNYVITVTAGDAELTENITDETYESGNSGGGNTPVATTVTVSFYENKGDSTAITTKQVNSGSSIGSGNMPDNPEKTGYTFAGWKKSTDDSAFTDSTTVSVDTSVYAAWTVAVSSTATFGNANIAWTDYFGKVVTGYTPTGGGTWRLFYADGNYAYLIRDSIGNQGLGSINGFSSITAVSDFAKNFNPQYHNWTLQTNSSLNNNLKGVEALMTPGNWTNYKVDGVAEWAVGAPTLEMFVASYNATHTSEMHTADSNVIAQQIACTVESGDSVTGYKVKKGNEAYNTYTNGLGNTSDLDKAIYCPNSGYWWLASPSAYCYSRVMYVGNGGSGSLYSNNYSLSIGVRPLVSVPISKIGLSNSDKTIKVQNYYFNP